MLHINIIPYSTGREGLSCRICRAHGPFALKPRADFRALESFFFSERRMGSVFGKVNGGSDAIIQFGRCRVLPLTRQLMVDGHSKELGTRAFDLLIALASAPSTVVKKGEILARVWPDTIVGEANLKVQMSALRKALSEDRDIIKTIHAAAMCSQARSLRLR
jgi:DNA-binding response OmpR family regulator